jgi:hypothetical protein
MRRLLLAVMCLTATDTGTHKPQARSFPGFTPGASKMSCILLVISWECCVPEIYCCVGQMVAVIPARR